MNKVLVAAVTFDSTHEDPSCGEHLHGHTFTVRVSEVADLRGLCASLHDDLYTLTRSLHLHVLGEMLYGGSQSLDGIAAWVMERLILEHPRITTTEVSIGDRTGVVTREIR